MKSKTHLGSTFGPDIVWEGTYCSHSAILREIHDQKGKAPPGSEHVPDVISVTWGRYRFLRYLTNVEKRIPRELTAQIAPQAR